jgi:hypothetical protein
LVRIPDTSGFNAVLTHLKKQNPEFNTLDWTVMSHKVNEKEQTQAFSIDPESHKALANSNFKAFWGFRTLKEEKKHLKNEGSSSKSSSL